MSLVRPLIAGVLLLAASTSAIGPPNGTAGTLDFRYPDYIVKPLVECPFEGYFPHPRDNTWFYRCYNRYGHRFFWRAYFQCKPCTVFSDALDQCVFQETGTKCLPPPEPCQKTLGDCRLIAICPAATTNRAVLTAIDACFKTSVVCPGQPDKPLCQDGYVYDRTNGQCRVGTPGSQCLLPPFPPTPSHIIPPTTQPTTQPILPPTTQPTPPLSTTKRTPTDVNDYIDNFFVCETIGHRPSAEGYRTLGCSERQFCNSAGQPMRTSIGCQSYLECSPHQLEDPPQLGSHNQPGGLQLYQRKCPAGQHFFHTLHKCTDRDDFGLYDCSGPTEPLKPTTTSQPTTPPFTTTSTPATTTTKRTPADVNDYIDNFFVCETPGHRPSAEGYQTLGCSERQFCNSAGQAMKTSLRCQSYLECGPDLLGGLKLHKRKCPARQHFFYEHDKCADSGDSDLHDCTPYLASDCTFDGQTLGMVGDEINKYCHIPCPSHSKMQGNRRYCDHFYQCKIHPDTEEYEVRLAQCRKKLQKFDRVEKECIMTSNTSGCIMPA